MPAPSSSWSEQGSIYPTPARGMHLCLLRTLRHAYPHQLELSTSAGVSRASSSQIWPLAAQQIRMHDSTAKSKYRIKAGGRYAPSDLRYRGATQSWGEFVKGCGWSLMTRSASSAPRWLASLAPKFCIHPPWSPLASDRDRQRRSQCRLSTLLAEPAIPPNRLTSMLFLLELLQWTTALTAADKRVSVAAPKRWKLAAATAWSSHPNPARVSGNAWRWPGQCFQCFQCFRRRGASTSRLQLLVKPDLEPLLS